MAVASTMATACAVTPVASKRPLTEAGIEAVGETEFVVVENANGMVKGWFMQDSSAAGASQGLIGALVVATIDAIANAGPSRRAQRLANEISEHVTPDMLSASLTEKLEAQMGESDSGVRVMKVTDREPFFEDEPRQDTVDIVHGYKFSEDGSTFQVVADVTYTSSTMPYETVYTFEKSVPKSELSGPLYRNAFVYNSVSVPVPVLSDEIKQDMVEAVKASYADPDGTLPVDGDDDYKKYTKEIEKAQDDDFTKSEASVLVTQTWLKNDAELLKQEISRAHDFIATMILADMNSTEIPSLNGQDEIMNREDDGRFVRKVGSTVESGWYTSNPGDDQSFVTYGNTFAIASDNRSLVRQRKSEAKQKRREAKKKK